MKEKIIYEDQDIIVVNKPSGLPTQSTEKKKGDDLYSLLQTYLNQREQKNVYLALHHRLDSATRGIILFCKNKKYNKYITDLFRNKEIIKKYIAVVDIETPILKNEWIIENKLLEYKFKHYKKTKSSSKGKTAITEFKVLKKDDTEAIIECLPKTGRLHQIRAHLSEMGLPIKGDFHYNKKYKNEPFSLYAYFLSFPHPRTKKWVTFFSNDYPEFHNEASLKHKDCEPHSS